LTLDLAGAPSHLDSGGYGRDVFLKTVGEADYGAELATLCVVNPLAERPGMFGLESCAKAEGYIPQIVNLWALNRQTV